MRPMPRIVLADWSCCYLKGGAIIASHEDCKVSAKVLAEALSTRSDLKGGGKPTLVQMGGGSKPSEEYAALVREVVENA